jgi:hypothetical protein
MGENGTLQKLTQLRSEYLASVQAIIDDVNAQISAAQSKYLDALVDATLGDPRIMEIQRILKTRLVLSQPSMLIGPLQEPGSAVGEEGSYGSTVNTGLTTEGKATEAATPIGQSGDPEKFPMKTRRTRPSPKQPFCPACGATILEPNARFCSKCASPLIGLTHR